MNRLQLGDQIEDGSYQYGDTGSFVLEGFTATASAQVLMSARCGHLTGKKTLFLVSTDANGYDYTIYESYNPALSTTELTALETDALAGTVTKLRVDATTGSGSLINSGTDRAFYEITSNVKVLIVVVTRTGGTNATGNLYFAGS